MSSTPDVQAGQAGADSLPLPSMAELVAEYRAYSVLARRAADLGRKVEERHAVTCRAAARLGIVARGSVHLARALDRERERTRSLAYRLDDPQAVGEGEGSVGEALADLQAARALVNVALRAVLLGEQSGTSSAVPVPRPGTRWVDAHGREITPQQRVQTRSSPPGRPVLGTVEQLQQTRVLVSWDRGGCTPIAPALLVCVDDRSRC
jgi:hypothetical protein